jgi:hypothetical protein
MRRRNLRGKNRLFGLEILADTTVILKRLITNCHGQMLFAHLINILMSFKIKLIVLAMYLRHKTLDPFLI